jgi:hypothetical protein
VIAPFSLLNNFFIPGAPSHLVLCHPRSWGLIDVCAHELSEFMMECQTETGHHRYPMSLGFFFNGKTNILKVANSYSI